MHETPLLNNLQLQVDERKQIPKEINPQGYAFDKNSDSKTIVLYLKLSQQTTTTTHLHYYQATGLCINIANAVFISNAYY